MQEEETIVTDDTTNVTEETDNTASVADEVEALKEQNKKLFERAKKAEGFVKDADGSWVKKESKPQANISEQQSHKPSDILKAPEFRLSRQGYDETEIDIIMHNGGPEILKDEKHPVTLGIKIAREQKRAEDASSQVSDKSSLSEVERKYTPEQMRNMKPEELAKLIGYAS